MNEFSVFSSLLLPLQRYYKYMYMYMYTSIELITGPVHYTGLYTFSSLQHF